MYELAGIQQVSFDMENMRSAAAVIALDQTRDTVFQAQLDGIAGFVKRVFRALVNFNAEMEVENESGAVVEWPQVRSLIEAASIDLKPVHVNSPLGNKGTSDNNPQPDYRQIQTAKAVVEILNGEATYEDMSFLVDKRQITIICAATMVKLDALGIDVPEAMTSFMIAAFLDGVQKGDITIAEPLEAIAPGADVGNG
jgi:hypothetical protein